jgi:hypothetical protein
VTSVDAIARVRLQITPTDHRDAVLEETYADLAERLIPKALDLVMRVRDEGRESIGAFLGSLSELERHALPVVLAAMVPPDRGVADLLDWLCQPAPIRSPRPAAPRSSRALQPCGTHAAFVRHKLNSETPDEECVQAERTYQASRKRTIRTRRQGATS